MKFAIGELERAANNMRIKQLTLNYLELKQVVLAPEIVLLSSMMILLLCWLLELELSIEYRLDELISRSILFPAHF